MPESYKARSCIDKWFTNAINGRFPNFLPEYRRPSKTENRILVLILLPNRFNPAFILSVFFSDYPGPSMPEPVEPSGLSFLHWSLHRHVWQQECNYPVAPCGEHRPDVKVVDPSNFPKMFDIARPCFPSIEHPFFSRSQSGRCSHTLLKQGVFQQDQYQWRWWGCPLIIRTVEGGWSTYFHDQF